LEAVPKLPTAELFVQVYVWVDDAIASGAVAIPPRPGPAPDCTDAEVLALAAARHLLAGPSERGWLAEVRRDRSGYFPRLPAQSGFNRRVCWLWGAFEQLRRALAAGAPEDGWQQPDTSALPVKHPSRVRGPDRWDGPNGLSAGFGWDAAHREWLYGFRQAARTDLGGRLVRAWGIVPAAVDERAAGDGLLEGVAGTDLLLDRGFVGRARAAEKRGRGIRVVLAHGRAERRKLPPAARRPVAKFRDRVETALGEVTDTLGLARHRAKTFWGLLARAAATLLAHTWLRLNHA
jgi:hypothetical protein